MDEQTVFERFHEALELEPHGGAYERFRTAFVNPPVAARTRPPFQMRFSRMGLRVAAALVVVVIAIAVGAAILATHHAPTGYAPAAPDKKYETLVLTDYNNFVAATSNHCNTIDDQGCAAAIAHLLPSMQKWVSDLTAYRTPAQFVVLDGRLRAHLNQAEADLNAAAAAQQKHDAEGFTLAINAALYERAWIDPASFTLEGSYPQAAASYGEAVKVANRSLRSCIDTSPVPDALACVHVSAAEACLGAGAQSCADDTQSAETQLQNYIVAIAQNPPPASLAGKDREFESALVDADNTLLDLTNAQLSGNSPQVSSDELAYLSAISAAATYSEGLTSS